MTYSMNICMQLPILIIVLLFILPNLTTATEVHHTKTHKSHHSKPPKPTHTPHQVGGDFHDMNTRNLLADICFNIDNKNFTAVGHNFTEDIVVEFPSLMAGSLGRGMNVTGKGNVTDIMERYYKDVDTITTIGRQKIISYGDSSLKAETLIQTIAFGKGFYANQTFTEFSRYFDSIKIKRDTKLYIRSRKIEILEHSLGNPDILHGEKPPSAAISG